MGLHRTLIVGGRMSTLDPEDPVILQLYHVALALKQQRTDLSKPDVAKAMLSIMPEGSQQAVRMMAVLMRMEPSVESPEWAAMTREQKGEAIATAIASMPEGFWEDD
jgi:hypothetical protein